MDLTKIPTNTLTPFDVSKGPFLTQLMNSRKKHKISTIPRISIFNEEVDIQCSSCRRTLTRQDVYIDNAAHVVKEHFTENPKCKKGWVTISLDFKRER